MKVIVFGATGYVGTAIENELVARGHDVVGVARTLPSTATGNAVPAGLTTVAGSLFDDGFLTEIAAGADAIVVAIPGREIDEHRLSDAVPALLATAASIGARVAVVGGAGSLLAADGSRIVDAAEFPDAYKPEALGHTAVLDSLRASGTSVDWFYLSPPREFGSFAPGERTGVYRLGGDSPVVDASGRSYISGVDYAIAFVDEVEAPAHHRTRFTVGY